MEKNKVVYIGQLLLNDLKHIHLHAIGENFDTVHELTQELYDTLSEQVDELAEFALSDGCEIKNLTDIKSSVDCDSEYTPLDKATFDFDEFCKALKEQGTKFLDILQDSDFPGYVKDDILNFWDKEINFKNELRMVDSPSEETEEKPIDDEGPLPPVNWEDTADESNFNADPGYFGKLGYIKPFSFRDERFKDDGTPKDADEENTEELTRKEKSEMEKSQNVNGWSN